MNTQQMEYFVTCAALLNFQRAAKYHYTSVSTISRNISALEKQLKFDFVLAGHMIKTVADGGAHMGIETAVQLHPYTDSFDTATLFSSSFQLLVDGGHPLSRRRSIGVCELLRDYGTYDAFVFDDQVHPELPGRGISGEDELRSLGEMTVKHLPRIFNKYCGDTAMRATNELMILAPQALRDPHFRTLRPMTITGADITTEYKLFWKKSDTDSDIPRFIELVSRLDNV